MYQAFLDEITIEYCMHQPSLQMFLSVYIYKNFHQEWFLKQLLIFGKSVFYKHPEFEAHVT